MKIIEQRAKFLTNAEVLVHLSEIQMENEWAFTIPQKEASPKRKHKRFNPQLQDLEIATKDVSMYLTRVQPMPTYDVEVSETLKASAQEDQLKKNESEIETADVQAKFIGELTKTTGIRLANLITGLNKYPLMEVEKLMIANTLPRNLVGLCAVVEECEERLGDQHEEILQLVGACYPEIHDAPEGQEEEGMEDIQEEEEEVLEELEDEQFEADDDLEHEGRAAKATDMEIDEVAES